MLGSPVENATIGDWNNSIHTGGFSGSNSPNWDPTIYTYDEATRGLGNSYDSGYVATTDTADTLFTTLGYMVWVTSAPVTVDVVGPLNQGTNVTTGTLSHNVGGVGTSEDGWHLRSNPYASPVLWTEVTKVREKQ